MQLWKASAVLIRRVAEQVIDSINEPNNISAALLASIKVACDSMFYNRLEQMSSTRGGESSSTSQVHRPA
eukprot:6209779-Pleurochrysis_carterae.AAC.1